VSLAVSLLALVLAGPAQPPQAPAVKATPSKGEVSLGETFGLDLEASGPPGTIWTFPAEAGNENVELRTPPPDTRPSATASTANVHHYQAAAFALGNVEIPPVLVKYRLADGTEGETATSPVSLHVLSVLPKDPNQRTLADIRGPTGISIGAAFWAAAAAALVLAGALVYWLVRRRRRRSEAVPAAAPAVAADVEARAALDRLAASGALGRGEYRPFYIALAEVAKRYLERRLGAPVLEMTSSEMVAFLRDHPHGQGLASAMKDIAGAADHVKFARGSAVAVEAERHLAGVRQMVDLMESRLQPKPADAPGAKVA
jgi:hypothetical protein